MGWVMLVVGLAFVGLVVLGACTFRVFVALRRLGRELETAHRRLEPRQVALRRELERLERSRGGSTG